MARRTKTTLILALALAACGQAQSSPSRPKDVPEEVAILSTDAGLDLVAADGELIASVPGGVASPDYDVLVSTQERDGSTLVRRLDTLGTELSRAAVPGNVIARVVSGDGALVALTEPGAPGSTTYAPTPRSSTRIDIVDAEGATTRFDLDGNFEPEAFSTDGEQLFLLEYIPAQAPTRYRVRRLRLDTGRVVPIGRLKTGAPNQMQGTGRAQVYSPWGDELYTLYTQQDAPGHHDTAFEGNHAFVHLLNLESSWTHCIDLPHSFGHGTATASALAVTPSGSHLVVVDWSSGVVADASPDKLKVMRTETVAFGAPDDQTFAAATEPRLYVAGGNEIVVLDTTSLEVVGRWGLDSEITGLSLSDDGARLLASTSDALTTIDADDGRVIDEVPTADAHGVAHVETAP